MTWQARTEDTAAIRRYHSDTESRRAALCLSNNTPNNAQCKHFGEKTLKIQHCFSLCKEHVLQIWVRAHSHHKQTTPEFMWDWIRSLTGCGLSQCGCFGLSPSAGPEPGVRFNWTEQGLC